MKKTVLLLVLATILLIGSANADVIYKTNGHHILEDETNYTSGIIGFYQEEELTFYTENREITSEKGYTQGSSMLYFRLKYQDENMSLKEIDNVTLECHHQTWKDGGVGFGFYDIANETQVLLFDKDSRQSENFLRLNFQVYDNDKVYCIINTFWDIEEWKNKGRQPPDFNGLSMAFEFPSGETDYCQIVKWELESEIKDFFYDSQKEIQGYILAFLLMNYKILIILYWIFKIAFYPLAFILLLLVIRYVIDSIKRLLQKKQQSTLVIRRR
jgi:hypothetical protein